MKRWTVIITVLLSSCAGEENKQETAPGIQPEDSTAAGMLPAEATGDSLIDADKCFATEDISEKEYRALLAGAKSSDPVFLSDNDYAHQFFSLDGLSEIKKSFWKLEAGILRGNKLIERKEDHLVIKGKKAFTNKYSNFYDKSPDGLEHNFIIDEFYVYDGKLPISGIDCIVGYYYEGMGYFLVDANGKVVDVPGNPCESPGGNFIFCTFIDLVAGFSTNGFCILKKADDGSLTKLCEVLPSDYGLDNVAWISDTEVIARKESLEQESMESVFTYVKITLKTLQ